MAIKRLIGISGLALSLCAVAGGEPPARGIAPPTRIPEPVPESSQPAGAPVNTASMPREVRRAVVADAARRFNVAESAVVLVSAEQVTWSDGSLGCAEPGQMYAQALVPGYRVTAKTQAGQLRYHTDSGGTVVTCAADRYRPGKKNLPADATGTGAEPRTQPPARATPDR